MTMVNANFDALTQKLETLDIKAIDTSCNMRYAEEDMQV